MHTLVVIAALVGTCIAGGGLGHYNHFSWDSGSGNTLPIFTFCMLGSFYAFVVFGINFFKIYFRNTTIALNGLDPDQDRAFDI